MSYNESQFHELVDELHGDTTFRPLAWALGYGLQHNGKVLVVWFGHINHNSRGSDGTAVILREFSKPASDAPNGQRVIPARVLRRQVLPIFRPFRKGAQKHKAHPNIDQILSVLEICKTRLPYGMSIVPVFAHIDNAETLPEDVGGAYLALTMLSLRMIRPRQQEIVTVFTRLPVVAFTTHGYFDAEDRVGLEQIRRDLLRRGQFMHIMSQDKFPPMVNFVLPLIKELPGGKKLVSRIADAMRVRIGASPAPGTTFMYEGAMNFNAGTEGPSMVEGSVPQGSIMGEGAEMGARAGIIGNIAGGGHGNNDVGAGSIIGTLSSVDIGIGPNNLVAGGLVVTRGTPVKRYQFAASLHNRDYEKPTVVKAVELENTADLLWLRNGLTGALEVFPLEGKAVELKEMLSIN